MDPIEKLRQGARRASGYLDLHHMTGSEEMRQRCEEELTKVLNDKEIEYEMCRLAWEDHQANIQEDWIDQ